MPNDIQLLAEAVPAEFFREAWQDADHPMAAVDTQNRFIVLNHAFERMLGYSAAEMVGHTWLEFTRTEDVGRDLISVQSVMDGKSESYRMEKDYCHKRGHWVPVVLTVRRYPRDANATLTFFRVEAPIVTATRTEVNQVHDFAKKLIDDLQARVDKLEGRGLVSMNNTNAIADHGANANADSGNRTTSQNQPPYGMFVVVFAVVALVIAAMFKFG
jgi:PAS domain S-box-containing protein